MISHIDIGYNGRLGNQLFIYALLFKLKTQGKEVSIPSTNYHWKQDGCLDQYHMKWIPYKYVLEDYFDLSIQSSNIIPSNIWEEPKQGYHSEVFNLDNISLKGYFQSWKYFDDIKEELKNELSFKSTIKEKIDLIYSSYSSKPTVCIHIRLGDTLSQSWMHKLSPEYIQDCFSHLPPDEYNFIIVSDNFEYCKDWFPQSEDIYFAEGLDEAETIYLMSLCDHFIMSGSTFSWWGAYLGQKEHSIVLFPNHFDSTDRDLNLFYHPTWKLINI
jgi:hypothetical protein